MLPGEFAQVVMEARFGQHHAGIGQYRFGNDAGDIAIRQRNLKRRQIVELNNAGAFGQVAELTRETRPVDRLAVAQPHHRLVHRAMIAAVEDEDLVAAGDRARDTQRKAVRVGGGGRDLPRRKPELVLEQSAELQRVFTRQHVGQPAPCLSGDGARNRGRGMAEHRARIPEAEIVQLDAVETGDRRAFRLAHDERKRQRPVLHPVHRHAAEKIGDAISERRAGERAGGRVGGCFGRA